MCDYDLDETIEYLENLEKEFPKQGRYQEAHLMGNAVYHLEKLQEDIAQAQKDKEVLEEVARKTVTRMNKVTSCHRHGRPIDPEQLDRLCNLQLDLEKALQGERDK